jgi:hypothetical protein
MFDMVNHKAAGDTTEAVVMAEFVMADLFAAYAPQGLCVVPLLTVISGL